LTVRALRLAIVVLLFASYVDAQSLNPGPPGPFVVDVRGVTSGLPTTAALYPELTFQDAVPSRGFGFDIGAHVYRFHLGPARLGLGANYLRAHGSAADARVTMQLVAPQLSFNFGTANGWSYVSAGAGPVRVQGDSRFDTRSINAGGGARWFTNNHIAISFDIRLYRLYAIRAFPRTMVVSASVGVSVK
jgi:hypothetical protein